MAISVQRPATPIPGRGGVNVRMQAKLGGDLPGVEEYLSFYPYSCFEQQASIAIGLRNQAAWNALMGALPEYLDRDGMMKYWPLLRYGSDTLTAYVLSVADEAGWEIPDDSRRRMEAALVGFIEGRVSARLGPADRRPGHSQGGRAWRRCRGGTKRSTPSGSTVSRSNRTCGRPRR